MMLVPICEGTDDSDYSPLLANLQAFVLGAKFRCDWNFSNSLHTCIVSIQWDLLNILPYLTFQPGISEEGQVTYSEMVNKHTPVT